MKTYKSMTNRLELKKIKSDIPRAKITSSKDVCEFAKQFYSDDIGIYESMFLMLLNRNNVVEGWAKISQGGTAGTVVDLKIIAHYAINSLAENVILIHNHPSGNTKPSDPDIKITKKVKEGLMLLDIKLLDHVIITEDNGYYSFSDNDKLFNI